MEEKADSKLTRELRAYIKDKKAIIGTARTLKKLRTGKLSRVFVSSNCPEKIENDVLYYAKLSKVEVIKIERPNDEFGTICKKPFSVSILGLLREAQK